MLCRKCLKLFESGPEIEELAEPALSEYLNVDDRPNDQPLNSSEYEPPWRVHHAQDVDIRRSVEEDCIICTRIWEHIDKYFLSRDDDKAQPFVLQRPQSNAQEAIAAHEVVVWCFLVAWRVGRSTSFMNFYLIPSEYHV